MPPPSPGNGGHANASFGAWIKANKQMLITLGGVLACVVVGFLVLNVVGNFAIDHPFIFWSLALFGGFVVMVTLLAIAASKVPRNCYICNNALSNHVYTQFLDGQSRRICSHCNQTMQRQNSRDAMKRRQ